MNKRLNHCAVAVAIALAGLGAAHAEGPDADSASGTHRADWSVRLSPAAALRYDLATQTELRGELERHHLTNAFDDKPNVVAYTIAVPM